MSIILGPRHGHAVLTGTHGNDVIIAQGAANTINGGGGSDYVYAGTGGFANVTAGQTGDGKTNLNDTVALFGSSNIITTGDENLTIFGRTTGSEITLGNGSNTISLTGTGNSVSGGYGPSSISALGGNATIKLVSNVVPGSFEDHVIVSGQHNTAYLALTNGRYPAIGSADLHGGVGFGTFTGFTDVYTEGPDNSITASGGTIVAGSGYDTVSFGNADVVLAGLGNDVTCITTDGTITGGSGNGTFQLQHDENGGLSGTISLVTGGLHNSIGLFAGDYVIDAGSGDDTVSAELINGSLTFHGTGDQFLTSYEDSYSTTVRDQSRGLEIAIQQGGPGALTIDTFDRTGLIDFNTAIGFTSVNQVLSDIHETSAGTFVLAMPDNSGTITFIDPVHLTAANFRIG